MYELNKEIKYAYDELLPLSSQGHINADARVQCRSHLCILINVSFNLEYMIQLKKSPAIIDSYK